MPYEPRTIAFLCELFHAPQALDVAPLQRVHNSMFESGAPVYASFNATPLGVVLSRPMTQPGAVSSATFMADRFQFREELSGMTVDEFAARVRGVTEMVARERAVPLFTAQVVTLRTLINPRTYQDARTFLKEGVFGFDDQVEGFQRPTQLYGLRMVFPPTAEEPNAYNLRVESFTSDPRSLFLENQASFGPSHPGQGLGAVEDNIRAGYTFIVERALPFVQRFDQRQEA